MYLGFWLLYFGTDSSGGTPPVGSLVGTVNGAVEPLLDVAGSICPLLDVAGNVCPVLVGETS